MNKTVLISTVGLLLFANSVFAQDATTKEKCSALHDQCKKYQTSARHAQDFQKCNQYCREVAVKITNGECDLETSGNDLVADVLGHGLKCRNELLKLQRAQSQ